MNTFLLAHQIRPNQLRITLYTTKHPQRFLLHCTWAMFLTCSYTLACEQHNSRKHWLICKKKRKKGYLAIWKILPAELTKVETFVSSSHSRLFMRLFFYATALYHLNCMVAFREISYLILNRNSGRTLTKRHNLLVLLFSSSHFHYFLVHQHRASTQKIMQWKQSDHSDVYSVVKVLRKETALPRCRATDSRWNKKPVSLGSSVMAVILRLNSCVSSTARWFHGPPVSIVTRTKT